GDIESAQIKCVFGGKLKPQVTMIETATYNGESVLKASLPAGYMEYGVDMEEVIEQAQAAGQGLLIVTDDNFSLAFSKETTATMTAADAEISVRDVTADKPANVVKSGLTPAGAYEAEISSGFTGTVEMGLPTGKLAKGATAEVYYVDTEGNKTAMNAKTVTDANGATRSQFTTTHNSTYVVVHEGGEVTEEPTEPETPAEPDIQIVDVVHAINVVTGAVAKNNDGAIVTTARENETISISWTARTGFGFVKWDLSGAAPADAAAAATTFVMGRQDVTVDFEEKLIVADEVKEELPSDTDTATKVKSLKFEKSKLTIQRGLEAVANPAKAEAAQGEAPEIIYVTDNKDIVAVDKSGNFWPMGVGEAEVTAYCGNKKAACKVTVVSYTTAVSIKDMSGADVSGQTIDMKGGEQSFLSVSFAPYDSTDPRDVSWKSDNKAVSVKAGMLTAKEVKEAVTATITATVKATDPVTGKVSKEIVGSVKVKLTPVVVAAPAALDKGHSLSLKKSKVKLTTLDGGNTAALGITLTAKKDTDISTVKILSVESSNTDVVTVDAPADPVINGKKAALSVKLTTKAAGTAYVVIKSTAGEGDKVNVKRCKVTVLAPAKSISVKSGTLKVTDKKITMRKGEKGTVEAELNPRFSTDLGKIKISASGGVTIKKGVIYAKKITKTGKPAKITVKCGKLKETIEVTVTR
ncbi:MAG: hypothetical protein K6B44_11380, partial [Lachnospiraceae bacterium]|nr:hypothetical protein [Lachnospiraceae bacterium]